MPADTVTAPNAPGENLKINGDRLWEIGRAHV